MSLKTLISSFICSVLLVSCATSKNTGHQELTKEIDHIYKEGGFNGFAVAVVDDKGILYEKGFGFSDAGTHRHYTEKTVQNIASVSKTLVGIALLKAQELGKLHLDDPISKYLPFKVRNPSFADSNITIRQLANHTSSIRDNEFYLSRNYYLKPHQELKGTKLQFDDEQVFNPADSIISMRSFLEYTVSETGKWNTGSFSEYRPGTFYEYSNTGTALAALVVEEATGMQFNDFTRKYILNPLKMKSSGWKFSEVPFTRFSRLYEGPGTPLPYYEMVTYPDGGLISSVGDLGLFLSELIKGYKGSGTLLTKESYKEYFKPQLSASNFSDRNEHNPFSESFNVGTFIGYGYTGYIGHTGGDPGVLSMMFFNPATGIGRIMIFNTNFHDKKGNDAFYGIWNLLEKYEKSL